MLTKHPELSYTRLVGKRSLNRLPRTLWTHSFVIAYFAGGYNVSSLVTMADQSSAPPEKVYPSLPAGESTYPPPPDEKSPLVEGYPPQQGQQPPPYSGEVPQVHLMRWVGDRERKREGRGKGKREGEGGEGGERSLSRIVLFVASPCSSRDSGDSATCCDASNIW